METPMRVEFRYQSGYAETDEVWEFEVDAEVELSAPAVTDRRPEHCHPGESASSEISVFVYERDERVELDEAEVDRRCGRGTYRDIREEAIRYAESA
jgi:hypothetical protein